MGKCVVLVGGSGSGKTTLAKELEKKGFRRVITYTTRPKRPGEIHGVDYHFISDKEFERKMDEGFFAETIVYKTPFGYCYYGSAKEDYNSQDNTVVVLDPRGVINLTEPAFIVHLDLRESVLRERLFERGDSPAYIEKRLADDKLYFEEMLKRHTPDLTIKASSRIDYMGDLVLDSMDL